MSKTVFITGATDGLGLEAAKHFAAESSSLIVHGRNAEKLEQTRKALSSSNGATVFGYRADLSHIHEVDELISTLSSHHPKIDVLINNAGVFKTQQPVTNEGIDVRFMVNTIAPYVLTQGLLSSLPPEGRIINLSSAAQSPVDLDALLGKSALSDSTAYAQSKLAITMWSFALSRKLGDLGPPVIAVNPGSFLATKMVKEAYGRAGSNLNKGAEILLRAASDDEFAVSSGRYFDNDRGEFAQPHPDALDTSKIEAVVTAIETVVSQIRGK